MASVYLAQVSIPMYTALPEDVVTNTFHFYWANISPPTNGDELTMLALCEAFYEDIFATGGNAQMAAYMRPLLTTAKLYNIADPKPRAPLQEVSLPLTVSQDTNSYVPTETSLCLSYQAPKTSGVAQAHRRGRVYIGGLGANTGGTGTSSAFPRPSAGFLTQLQTAGTNLIADSAAADMPWCVFSPTLWAQTGGPPTNAAAVITDGWIDNTYDTQRRRGVPRTARTLFT